MWSLRQTQFSSSQFCHGLHLLLIRWFSCPGWHRPPISASVFLAFFSQVVHLQSLPSDVFLVSTLNVSIPSQYCFPVPLCHVLYFKSIPHSLVSPFLAWSLSVWPHAHLHFCHFQFLHVWASDWHCFHPVELTGWTIILWIFPFTCGGTLLPHRTPDIFLQLLHPHCVLLFIFLFIVSPTLCRVLPIIEFGDLSQLGRLHINTS